MADFQPEVIDQLLQRLDRELWIVTAQAGERRGGLLATFVAPASIVSSLPRMCVALSRQHHTWELVEASGAFGLHLVDRSQVDWVWHFGAQSGRDLDKLAELPHHPGKIGSPILKMAKGWLDCRVEARMETGDRTVYLAEVVEGFLAPDLHPLRTSQLFSQADPARKQQLRAQLQADAAVDAAAILAWRQTLDQVTPRDRQ